MHGGNLDGLAAPRVHRGLIAISNFDTSGFALFLGNSASQLQLRGSARARRIVAPDYSIYTRIAEGWAIGECSILNRLERQFSSLSHRPPPLSLSLSLSLSLFPESSQDEVAKLGDTRARA